MVDGQFVPIEVFLCSDYKVGSFTKHTFTIFCPVFTCVFVFPSRIIEIFCFLKQFQFLLMVCGLSQATADYACIWCTVHKNQRCETHHPASYWENSTRARTIQTIKQCAKGKKKLSVKALPIFNIPLDHVIPDELHMMLRICT